MRPCASRLSTPCSSSAAHSRSEQRASRSRSASPGDGLVRRAAVVGRVVSRVASLQRGDRVRVVWGEGRTYDGTVQTTETALERHGRVDVAIDYAFIEYDDGERGQVWDGEHPGGHGAWEVTLLAAAPAPSPADSEARAGRKRERGEE